MREIGARAVHLLLAIIERVDVPLQQTLDFSLMVRGSTAAPAPHPLPWATRQDAPACPL
jgi:LacI family repressor for deo operon, udp, cdd, tsx, nupC, and nupG